MRDAVSDALLCCGKPVPPSLQLRRPAALIVFLLHSEPAGCLDETALHIGDSARKHQDKDEDACAWLSKYQVEISRLMCALLTEGDGKTLDTDSERAVQAWKTRQTAPECDIVAKEAQQAWSHGLRESRAEKDAEAIATGAMSNAHRESQ